MVIMKYLGIDYGEKKVGLSLAEGKLALPWQIIANTSLVDLLDKLKDIVKQEKITEIVVGVPWGLNRKKTDQTKKVLMFVEQLRQHLPLPISETDEFFSTKVSHKQGLGKNDDAVAAAHILQSYLDRLNNSTKND
jgi:putative Holliday junction resolvase